MKKVINIIGVMCILLSGCSGNSPNSYKTSIFSSDNISDNDEAGKIIINPDFVKITDVLPEHFPRGVDDEWLLIPNHPDRSNTAIRVLNYPSKSLGYQNDVEWVYAAYYPKFEELSTPGADKIHEYYKVKYEKAKEEAENYTLDNEIYQGSMCDNHSYLDWDSWTVGDYLVVSWYYDGYYGGSSDERHYYAEQFDLRTGKLLTEEDVFGVFKEAMPILKPIIIRHLAKLTKKVSESFWDTFDIFEETIPFLFQLEPEGVTFIYNKYTITSDAYFVLVPYDELRQVLKLNLGGTFGDGDVLFLTT